MSVELLETIKQQINQLSAEEAGQLAQYLHERSGANGATTTNSPDAARREEKRRLRAAWLKEHRAAYAGLYVALDGDRLLGTGQNYPEACAAAQQAGVKDAYVDFVYPADYVGDIGGW
jgi:hypothetical protein